MYEIQILTKIKFKFLNKKILKNQILNVIAIKIQTQSMITINIKVQISKVILFNS